MTHAETTVLVKAERLTKHYGRCVALEDVSLDVQRGEILALVGPNGAGKTTILKLLAGLLAPTSGRVMIAGYEMERASLEAKRSLSFVPDQPFVYEQLTVEEFLGFIGGVYRMPPHALAQRAEFLIRLFGLDRFVFQRISTLSYGMRSRVVLIASLLHEPQVFLMDEPFFGLDPQTLRLIKQLLLDLAKQGVAVVLSTHQLPVVEDLASRIAILSQGRLVALDRLDALTQRYGQGQLEDVFFHLTSPQASSPVGPARLREA